MFLKRVLYPVSVFLFFFHKEFCYIYIYEEIYIKIHIYEIYIYKYIYEIYIYVYITEFSLDFQFCRQYDILVSFISILIIAFFFECLVFKRPLKKILSV